MFRSAQMGNKLQVAAGTTALEFGRRRLARACRPAGTGTDKVLILGKLSKLSAWSINFLSNFAARTTRIVPAPLLPLVN